MGFWAWILGLCRAWPPPYGQIHLGRAGSAGPQCLGETRLLGIMQNVLWFLCSYGGSDATSGKEMSDSCEGAFGGGKLEGRGSRRHHRRSTRVRSRPEKANRPRLTILNVSGPVAGG